MDNLLARLEDIARYQRMSDIEAAEEGSPYHGNNFKGTFAGYTDRGNILVTYAGENIKAKSLAGDYISAGTPVYLRVGLNHKTVNY